MQDRGIQPTQGPPTHLATAVASPDGTVSAGHPLAAQAGVNVLRRGGSAVDAAIAAQAVICVVMPQAAGLGGDVLALVHASGAVHAVNGTGVSACRIDDWPLTRPGASVTVPGLVDGWLTAHRRWGRLDLTEVLAAAIAHAERGVVPDHQLLRALDDQRPRLVQGGGDGWSLLSSTSTRPTPTWKQPELAAVMAAVASHGRDAFYSGAAAHAIAGAVRRQGGHLDVATIGAHHTPTPEPLGVRWGEYRAFVQPPSSQGVLLAMALQRTATLASAGHAVDDHLLVEVTEAVFAHRSSCARGAELLKVELPVDVNRASRRGGPRAYLHTAGVAAADSRGQVVSSLVSVFDDFGSGVFVPELGIVLNNRAAGFTDGDNAPAPHRRPVHTLAPALLIDGAGDVLAIATPGADGQVQTLLQVLVAAENVPLVEAVGAPRWRSQDGALLVERGHAAVDDLRARGHDVVLHEPGADVFGAVVAAGLDGTRPYAVADWRRQNDARGV